MEKVFVLDGQQRIQTLIALFNGAIKSNDGKSDLEAYFDVASGDVSPNGDLLYKLQFHATPHELPLYRLRNLMTVDDQKNASTLAEDINDALDGLLKEESDIRKKRQRRVRENMQQIVTLLREDRHFWVEELDGVANEYPYKKILEIFVRVNSGGTKLDASDLMFAAMKEGWSDIEQNVEAIVDVLNGGRLGFDKTFALKCLVVANGKGAELTSDKFTSPDGEKLIDAIQASWARSEAAFQELRDFITNDQRFLEQF